MMTASPLLADAIEAAEIDRHVGRRVRQRRVLAGLSQDALACQIDVTYQQIQKYERGVTRISASRLYQIGSALEEPAAYFFAGLPGQPGQEELCAPVAPAASFLSAHETRREALEIVRVFCAIENPRLRQQVKALLRELYELGTHPNG